MIKASHLPYRARQAACGCWPREIIFRLFATLVLCLGSVNLGADAGKLLNLSIVEESGTVFLQLDQLPAEFLYVPALQSGVGSNDLGLDRGQLDRTRLVRFERYGNRVLLLEPNLAYRAETTNGAERKAVSEAFAQSVIAGFPIEAGEDQDHVKIDLAPLLLSDITRIAVKIADLDQGDVRTGS